MGRNGHAPRPLELESDGAELALEIQVTVELRRMALDAVSERPRQIGAELDRNAGLNVGDMSDRWPGPSGVWQLRHATIEFMR